MLSHTLVAIYKSVNLAYKTITLVCSFFRLAKPQVGEQRYALFTYVIAHHSIYRTLNIDGEATWCSWHTLWLHVEYRVYTSQETVCTELYFPCSAFFFFPLGCN